MSSGDKHHVIAENDRGLELDSAAYHQNGDTATRACHSTTNDNTTNDNAYHNNYHDDTDNLFDDHLNIQKNNVATDNNADHNEQNDKNGYEQLTSHDNNSNNNATDNNVDTAYHH